MDKNKIPTLFFDSELIIEKRKNTQKSWENESFYPWIFLRRISIYISYAVSKYTTLTPNNITVIGIILGLLMSFIFLSDNYIYHIVGVLLYNFVYLADCVDGEVARLTNKKSSIGHWLDSGLRYSLFLGFFAVMSTNLRISQFYYQKIVNILIVISILITIWCTDNERVSKVSKNSSNKIKKGSLFADFIIFLFATDPGFYIIYLLLIFTNRSLLLYWVLYHIFIFLLKSIYRLYTVYNSFKEERI